MIMNIIIIKVTIWKKTYDGKESYKNIELF